MRVINAITYPTFEQQQATGFVHLSQRHLYPQSQDETGKWIIPPLSTPDWDKITAALCQLDPAYEGIVLIDVESWPLQNVASPAVQADFAKIIEAVRLHCPLARIGFYAVEAYSLVAMCDLVTVPLYVGVHDTKESYLGRVRSVMQRTGPLNRPRCPLVMPRTKAGWMIEMGDWVRLRQLLASLGASAMLVWGMDKDREAFEPYCTP